MSIKKTYSRDFFIKLDPDKNLQKGKVSCLCPAEIEKFTLKHNNKEFSIRKEKLSPFAPPFIPQYIKKGYELNHFSRTFTPKRNNLRRAASYKKIMKFGNKSLFWHQKLNFGVWIDKR